MMERKKKKKKKKVNTKKKSSQVIQCPRLGANVLSWRQTQQAVVFVPPYAAQFLPLLGAPLQLPPVVHYAIECGGLKLHAVVRQLPPVCIRSQISSSRTKQLQHCHLSLHAGRQRDEPSALSRSLLQQKDGLAANVPVQSTKQTAIDEHNIYNNVVALAFKRTTPDEM